jgi:PBP1b-binding outer membrane lipoprotein LpoB
MKHGFGWFAAVAALALSLLTACGPEYTRGVDEPGLDDPAMSTGLDKRDLKKLLADNLGELNNSPLMNEWRSSGAKPQVAIYPLANETTEHVDSQLDSLLSDVEGWLVDSNAVTVISLERQEQMMAEVNKQHGGGFDRNRIAEYNKQLGAEFYITGKVYAADERTDDARRVQYFMHMQVIEVATSAIRFQNKAEVTKAVLD